MINDMFTDSVLLISSTISKQPLGGTRSSSKQCTVHGSRSSTLEQVVSKMDVLTRIAIQSSLHTEKQSTENNGKEVAGSVVNYHTAHAH